MDANEKILILGGTGHFGARISRRLACVPGIELLVTGRDAFRAEVLVDEILNLNPDSRITALRLDQESDDFEAELRAISPFCVVSAAGPFQGQDYRVARACIELGCHYIDLADGREFVANFRSLYQQAREAGVVLISGASTLPGISSAVVAGFEARFSRIRRIETSIAPAGRTPLGRGTLAAVLSYCGRPFEAWVDGRWQTRYGWQDLRRQEFPELGRRLSAAYSVPDLDLLPRRVPGIETVTFHAALGSQLEQLVLWTMAWLTRIKLVSDWSKHARRLAGLSRRMQRHGSDWGGMKVTIAGDDHDGQPLCIDWYMTARDNHGPEIPCTPAIVLVKKLLRDEFLERGAVACISLFTLDELQRELANYSISTRVEERTEF
ncbi:MAG: saccharopine dehydrogenase [Woeseiaceae bacterium]|nr:saccharopine dehydrogenase [Woeseiaceae bacterium]